MIDGSVLQSAQRCFEKKSRVVVKMVVKLLSRLSAEMAGVVFQLTIQERVITLSGTIA